MTITVQMEKLEEMAIVEPINNLSRLFGGFLTTRSEKWTFRQKKILIQKTLP